MAFSFPVNVSATYDINTPRIPNCSIPIKEGWKTSSLIMTFDSTAEQRRQKAPPRRTLDLTYVVLKKNEYLTIRDFFLSVTNIEEFSWFHPVEKVTIRCRFDMEVFAADYFTHGASGPLYKLSLRLIEVV